MFAPVSFLEPGFPHYPQLATVGEFYNNFNAWSSLGSPIAQTSGSSITVSNSYFSGVLGKDGFIYGIPFNSSNILRINPNNNTTSTFGNVTGSAKYAGGVLAPNGKIYCFPFNFYSVLIIDTDSQTTSIIAISGSEVGIANNALYSGGVLHQNGKIYGTPLNAAKVLEIDPSNDTFKFIGTNYGISGAKWATAAIGLDGNIYCAPYNNTTFLKVNPLTQTTEGFGNFAGGSKFQGICSAPNNKLYTIPYLATSSIKLDPINTGSMVDIPIDTQPFILKWYGGAVGTDGNIYGSALNSSSSLVINTTNDTVSQLGNYGASGDEKYTGLVLAPNGVLHHIPYNNGTLRQIVTNGTGKIPTGGPLIDMARSGYLNKF